MLCIRSRRQQNNSCSTVVSMEDRLSQLPDEVIVSILSQMTIREAVLTSSLAIQWHYLWMHVTRLKFDVSQFITWKMFYYPRLCRKEGMKHINLINNVLDFHKGGHLEEFTLSFPFHKHFKRVIDKCLNFVVADRRWKSNLLLENITSVLTIDFKMSRGLICELVHTFTTYFTLLTTLSLEFVHTSMNHCFLDHTLPKFNNLKVLVLKVVGVTDESLLGITPPIEASPYLQKLHIELAWHETIFSKNRIITKKCPHQHLKEVKYSGYLGGFADRVLTTYLTKNSVALETFIIVPLEYDAQEARGRARRQLQGKNPKQVKLGIL
ncbi:hypothetical protein MTR67_051209 [Solanum verrucosum]|uniref:F-box domain-containing protein n=1 Tax=Solanum verrucosum TaxID=315347 RepID=A0AAF0V617_SOLVR|nr:hypothetical protein MTR67_051209 [Solanum verrucosum]